MKQALPCEATPLPHELDLGRHMLLLLGDGSIELLASDEQTPSHPFVSGMRLDPDETYRLFLSLHDQFQHQRKEETNKKCELASAKSQLASPVLF